MRPRLRLFPWIGIILLATACGSSGGGPGDDDDDDDDDGGELAPFASGDRLRAVYYDGGAGAHMLQRWRDTELDIDCRFFVDEDGGFRCMPEQGVNLVYLDASCTEAAFEWSPCGDLAPPSMVVADAPTRCIGRPTVLPFAVGAAETASTLYYRDGDGCQAADGDPVTVYPATPLDPSMFAAGIPRHVDVGAGLGVRVVETDGGAHEILDLVSTTFEQRCLATALGDGDERYCLHGDLAYDFDRFHSDEACSLGDVAYSVGAPQCDPPAYVLTYTPPADMCGVYTASLAAIGAELDAGGVHEGAGASCFAASANYRYWSVGAPAANELPPVASVAVGDERLQVSYHATPDGARLMPAGGNFHDVDLGADCVLYETESADVRCFPGVYVFENNNQYFRDAQCTERVVEAGTSECYPDPDPSPLVAERGGDGCGAGTIRNVRTVGAEYTGEVYADQGSGCIPYTPLPTQHFFEVGASATLTDYPPVPLVTD